MKSILLLSLLLVSIYIRPAYAQCGAGVNAGGQCVPPEELYRHDGERQQQPQRQRTLWESRWGAIVIDRNTGQAGTVINYRSRAEAIDAAMHDCQVHGSPDCKVNFDYSNQCAAIAWRTGAFFTAGGTSAASAEASAMKGCEKGATACKIEYSGCSLPVKIR